MFCPRARRGARRRHALATYDGEFVAATYDEELDTANALAATQNRRAVSKRITVKVYILRAETEECDVQKQKLTTTKLKNRLIITITTKNKPAESKKIGVEFITYKQV
jgi:hypothetical protein